MNTVVDFGGIGDVPILLGASIDIGIQHDLGEDEDYAVESDGTVFQDDTGGTIGLPHDGNNADFHVATLAVGNGTISVSKIDHDDDDNLIPLGSASGDVYSFSGIGFSAPSLTVGDTVVVSYTADFGGLGAQVQLSNGITSIDVASSGSTVSLAGATVGTYFLRVIFADYNGYAAVFTAAKLIVGHARSTGATLRGRASPNQIRCRRPLDRIGA